jgi:phosphoglucosamine mutase
VVLVDERGEIVDGDQIMAVCARDLIQRDALAGRCVVATVMSNLGLEKALEASGGQLLRTQVGDRYVVEAMRLGGYNLGGEQSGHVIFLDQTTTGDGLMSALQVLGIMVRSQRRLSELTSDFQRFPQVMVNIPVARRTPLDQLPSMQEAIKQVEGELDGSGRVVIRYSGTELKARVMVEGEDEARVKELAHDLSDKLRHTLAQEAV